jgi:hypothetical protein
MKKPWRYMTVAGAVIDGEEFPPTKNRRKFKLPWRVTGKGIDNTGQINQASGKFCK